MLGVSRFSVILNDVGLYTGWGILPVRDVQGRYGVWNKSENNCYPYDSSTANSRKLYLRNIWIAVGFGLLLNSLWSPYIAHPVLFDKISRKACGEGQAHAVLGPNAKRNHNICKLNLLIGNPQNKLTCKLFVRQYALTWGIKKLTKDIISIVKTRLFK